MQKKSAPTRLRSGRQTALSKEADKALIGFMAIVLTLSLLLLFS
jgi:hypothetical protein